APPRAAVQVPDQQVIMTRQEMQQMVAEAAAQAVQQVTNSLSRATATSNTVAGSRQNAEEDEFSYGGGEPTHDREMERMAEQLRQLQAKVDGRAERRARGHPFSADILAAPLQNNYKDTNLVFDGTSDPSRHVRTFENMAVLHGYTDPVSCRAFLSTLRGGALDWFQQLPPGSIVDFEDFAEKLTNQYSSAVAQEKMYLTLMAIRQGEKESPRKYVARYNQACLEIPSAVDEVKAGGLIRSLRAGPCRTSLAKTPAHTYDEVFRRCRKYINLEETEAEFAKLEELGRGESRKEKADAAGVVVVPHNDALVITAEVAGFDVKRVFIDTGSSVDIMFYDCFVQINLELNVELKPVATALYGFNGGEVMPMGEVTLSVALGKGATRKVRMVRFVVVGAESSYNIIMGRTSLNAFQAVVSTYHMTIKYP
ncbi:Unknown protein, partial [Striga hermonthica]